jgi:hypothetical protein
LKLGYPRHISALAIVTVLCAACASRGGRPDQPGSPANAAGTESGATSQGRFDALFETGAWEEAAALFEADSALQIDESTLYRAGLIHADPDRDLYDPERVDRILGRLVDLFPESSYASPAGVLRGLVAELRRSAPEPEPRHHRFDALYEAGAWGEAAVVFEADSSLHAEERTLYRAGLMYAQVGGGVFDAGRATTAFERLIELFPQSRHAAPAGVFVGLVAEIQKSGVAIAALRQQLDRLKEVDLKPVVPPPPPPPPPPFPRGH